MDLRLRGRKAAVTGATRGIGRAIAQALADEGCDVAICARDAEQVARTVAQLQASGRRAFGRSVDAADGDALRAFIDDAAAAFGGLDIFVSNASGALGGENDEESWRRGLEVDVLGTMRGCEAALPYLEESGAGAIVVVSTAAVSEVVGSRRAYNSVKAAIHPYIKGLARDVAAKNVRCNIVSPGTILHDGSVWDERRLHRPNEYAAAVASNPMGRLGTPEEVADAVVFLASPRAGFISGANLVCDGARTRTVF
jgi:3-oxoacyl-[acyl-carrier protein] reductase